MQLFTLLPLFLMLFFHLLQHPEPLGTLLCLLVGVTPLLELQHLVVVPKIGTLLFLLSVS